MKYKYSLICGSVPSAPPINLVPVIGNQARYELNKPVLRTQKDWENWYKNSPVYKWIHFSRFKA